MITKEEIQEYSKLAGVSASVAQERLDKERLLLALYKIAEEDSPSRMNAIARGAINDHLKLIGNTSILLTYK